MNEDEILQKLDWQPKCAMVRPVNYANPRGPWCWVLEEDGQGTNLATSNEIFPSMKEAVASALEWSQTTNNPGCWLVVGVHRELGPVSQWLCG